MLGSVRFMQMTIVCMALSDSLILVCDLWYISLISVQISAYGIYVYSYRVFWGHRAKAREVVRLVFFGLELDPLHCAVSIWWLDIGQVILIF